MERCLFILRFMGNDGRRTWPWKLEIKMPYKIISLLIVLTLATSCSFKPKVGAPWMQKLLHEGPEGPTHFRQGWVHGCETGISATANRFQKSFYKFQQDYKLAQDPVYYSGWKAAFNYCQRYMFQYLRRNIL